ncbi:hypothetical protein NGB36_18710 [Streptomyces sp. RB6PN25]|uniref:Uncharacterized protein n=1 Tax=Streptomyces humicola TaxID=2953240 RepID=A0ABT1PY28_9ACTN|nr:hypothetical protein [Streptomyces humicola]MCQ4082578.1 hypothetical protein [Streptomyces humicola]
MQFDAVRVAGVRGEEVAEELITATHANAGPIVCEASGFRRMYFLLAPGTAADRRWPPGIQRFGSAHGIVAYVGIPALSGGTWPLFALLRAAMPEEDWL